jgi:2,3-bisphosphoglycerate-independent phosphoglycerate mutase
VDETSALRYVDGLEESLGRLREATGRRYLVASGGGRMVVTMDRYEADWAIVERGWRAHVLGEGRRFPSARAAIETYRQEQPGITDQFLPAFVVADERGPVGPVRDGDSVFFFNFRGDRAMELSRAFEQDDFRPFDRVRRPAVLYAGMMEYDGDLHLPRRFLVSPPAIDRTLGEYLCHNRVPLLAAAETQKYGHVTYFFNGNCSGLFDPASGRYVDVPAREERHDTYVASARRSALETYLEIRSDVVPFEQRPWMKAAEVTDAVIDELVTGRHRFARVNFANGDMVGHTGDREAAILAVATVDRCVGRLLETVRRLDGVALVTADHGNADEMIMADKAGKLIIDAEGGYKPKTSHTLNPVPFVLFDPRPDAALSLRQDLARPGLSNVAATVLALLGYEPPDDYDPGLLGS